MAGREVMLERIRKALGRSAAGSEAGVGTQPRPSPWLEGILPLIAPEDLLPKFEDELQKVAGLHYRAANALQLEGVLRSILASARATRVVLSRNPLLVKLGLVGKIRAWGMVAGTWPEVSEVIEDSKEEERIALRERAAASFSAALGITGVDFALAETGTLVLTSRTEGSQLASLAPPIHVALYRPSQLVASLEEVLEKLPISSDPKLPSPGRSVVFITGTSRTADIEQILIQGVHGPKEVHAILVEDSCL